MRVTTIQLVDISIKCIHHVQFASLFSGPCVSSKAKCSVIVKVSGREESVGEELTKKLGHINRVNY